MHVDVVVIGAGASGLFCAIEAGKRGRRVVVLDQANKVGKKILMSGGGRCNFTNLGTSHRQFISHNPHFCKSALSRYTPLDFIALVERHRIPYVEKKLGQLFCQDKSSRIVTMLLKECLDAKVEIRLNQSVMKIDLKQNGFLIKTQSGDYLASSLVIATGGLSIPTLGSSPLGYQIAAQFGLTVYPTRAGLVPLTLQLKDKLRYEVLSGVSMPVRVTCGQQFFDEDLLWTHRGLSGPAILQISSYWSLGHRLKIDFAPNMTMVDLKKYQKIEGDQHLKTVLSRDLPKRFVEIWGQDKQLAQPLKQYSDVALARVLEQLQAWSIQPHGTEGYRTAEVTLGGVDCDALSSKTFEVKTIPGLYFIGEVLDVTGWLGGYNFQWAWSSGFAAGQVV